MFSLFHKSTIKQINVADVCTCSQSEMTHVLYDSMSAILGQKEGVARIFSVLIDIDKGVQPACPFAPSPFRHYRAIDFSDLTSLCSWLALPYCSAAETITL